MLFQKREHFLACGESTPIFIPLIIFLVVQSLLRYVDTISIGHFLRSAIHLDAYDVFIVTSDVLDSVLHLFGFLVFSVTARIANDVTRGLFSAAAVRLKLALLSAVCGGSVFIVGLVLFRRTLIELFYHGSIPLSPEELDCYFFIRVLSLPFSCLHLANVGIMQGFSKVPQAIAISSVGYAFDIIGNFVVLHVLKYPSLTGSAVVSLLSQVLTAVVGLAFIFSPQQLNQSLDTSFKWSWSWSWQMSDSPVVRSFFKDCTWLFCRDAALQGFRVFVLVAILRLSSTDQMIFEIDDQLTILAAFVGSALGTLATVYGSNYMSNSFQLYHPDQIQFFCSRLPNAGAIFCFISLLLLMSTQRVFVAAFFEAGLPEEEMIRLLERSEEIWPLWLLSIPLGVYLRIYEGLLYASHSFLFSLCSSVAGLAIESLFVILTFNAFPSFVCLWLGRFISLVLQSSLSVYKIHKLILPQLNDSLHDEEDSPLLTSNRRFSFAEDEEAGLARTRKLSGDGSDCEEAGSPLRLPVPGRLHFEIEEPCVANCGNSQGLVGDDIPEFATLGHSDLHHRSVRPLHGDFLESPFSSSSSPQFTTCASPNLSEVSSFSCPSSSRCSCRCHCRSASISGPSHAPVLPIFDPTSSQVCQAADLDCEMSGERCSPLSASSSFASSSSASSTPRNMLPPPPPPTLPINHISSRRSSSSSTQSSSSPSRHRRSRRGSRSMRKRREGDEDDENADALMILEDMREVAGL